MKNLFNSVKVQRPNKNVFDLTHDVKLSLNMGELVPIMVMDCVPGDKVKLSCESLLRFAPLISPVMHRLLVTMHYFFVPNRLVWASWEKWITNGGAEPQPSTMPLHPTLNITASAGVGTVAYTRLHDYMGLPTPIGAENEAINPIALAAYQLIYNEYYRDQNLETPVISMLSDGDNSALADLNILRTRAWEHDYFTAALPFAQKGQAVTIPIASTFEDVPVRNQEGVVTTLLDGTPTDVEVNADTPIGVDPSDDLFAKTSELALSGDTTINDLRRAFRLQEWFEKLARGGSRYIETIRAMFGVNSSDKRLNRPEYITGTKSPVTISEVLNTTGTDDLPQGNMSGHAISVTSGKYGQYFCEEHGYIIGIMSVLPRTAYMQGFPKHFLKYTDPTEHYWPTFANLGEQEILNRELYGYQGAGPGSEVFGYIPRYAEYKYIPSRVAGDFKTTLDFWHLARKFATPPALDSAFIKMQVEEGDRIFAVVDPDVQKLYAHVLNKVMAVRPMPKYGTPTF